MPHLISKSRFMSGRQCLKRLWLEVYRPDLATPHDDATEHRFAAGHRAGELARTRFPGGVLVTEDYLQRNEALSATSQLLSRPDVTAIFEAAISGANVFARADILDRCGPRAWRMIEVKSTGTASEVHDWDLAVQLLSARAADIEFPAASLLLLNREYVHKGGAHDAASLFKEVDRTSTVEAHLPEVSSLLKHQLAVLDHPSPPDIAPSPHCDEPYHCPFWEHCTARMPDDWVIRLPYLNGSKYRQLADRGLLGLRQLPARSGLLSEYQENVREAVVSGKPWVSTTMKFRLEEYGDPPYLYLDFESLNPLLPIYPGTHPGQHIPFMFSLVSSPSTQAGVNRPSLPAAITSPSLPAGRAPEGGSFTPLFETHYIHDTRDDPRRPLADALLAAFSEFPVRRAMLSETPISLLPPECPALLPNYPLPLGSPALAPKSPLPSGEGEGEGIPLAPRIPLNPRIITYGTFEKQIIEGLAEALPDLAPALLALIPRLANLQSVVSRAYAHPETWGSTSLKDIAPVLAPDVTYSDLAIQDGGQASLLYLSYASGNMPTDAWPAARRQIVEYCQRDTLATARVHQALLSLH